MTNGPKFAVPQRVLGHDTLQKLLRGTRLNGRKQKNTGRVICII